MNFKKIADTGFNKVAGLRPATLLKKKLWHRRFPVNFVKFLRTPFLQNTSGRMLLNGKILSAVAMFWHSNKAIAWFLRFVYSMVCFIAWFLKFFLRFVGDKPLWRELKLYGGVIFITTISLFHFFRNSQHLEEWSVSVKNFFSKCECINSCNLPISSNLLKNSLRKTSFVVLFELLSIYDLLLLHSMNRLIISLVFLQEH